MLIENYLPRKTRGIFFAKYTGIHFLNILTHNSGDTTWILISAALVFIMTPAVALFYGGMVRSKNVLNTIMQSIFILGMVSVEFILIGYTLIFSADINGLIGDFQKIGLAGVGYNILEGGTIPELAFVAFQCMFAVLTPALITGAFAKRINFKGFAILMLLWAIFIYNPMAHWVWGGGFLAQLGALDFAGGLVIHIFDGANGLFYGETNLFFAQIISIGVAIIFAVIGSTILYKIVNSIIPLRVEENEEIIGLDIIEHGERGYNAEIFSGGNSFIADKEFETSAEFNLNHHGI